MHFLFSNILGGLGEGLGASFAIKSLNEEVAVIESFKTRDTEPFEFHIYKRYNKLMIEEFDGNLDDWDDL